MTNLWPNIDMSLTFSWNNYADNKTSEKQKVQRVSFCNLNGPGLLNQTLRLYPGSLHHCSRARKALIRYRAATAWPSWFSIYTVRPQDRRTLTGKIGNIHRLRFSSFIVKTFDITMHTLERALLKTLNQNLIFKAHFQSV